MNVSLLVNYGNRFCAPVNAVPPALPEQADISHITQQVWARYLFGFKLSLRTQDLGLKSQALWLHRQHSHFRWECVKAWDYIWKIDWNKKLAAEATGAVAAEPTGALEASQQTARDNGKRAHHPPGPPKAFSLLIFPSSSRSYPPSCPFPVPWSWFKAWWGPSLSSWGLESNHSCPQFWQFQRTCRCGQRQAHLRKKCYHSCDSQKGFKTLHVGLHFMACLVCTSENPSTNSSVKHWKILQSSNSNVTLLGATKDPLFCPLFVHALIKPLSKTLFYYNIWSTNPFLLFYAAPGPLLGFFGFFRQSPPRLVEGYKIW